MNDITSPEKKTKKLGAKAANAILLAFGAVGIVGGALRGTQLLSFDSAGFPTFSGGIHSIVWGLAVAELVLVLVLWLCLGQFELSGKRDRGICQRLFPLGSAVLFAAGAAVSLALSYRPFSIWKIFLGLVCFAIAAAVSIIAKALGSKAETSQGERLISLLPIGANVILIIELYRSVSKNPTPSWYAFDVFAAAAAILLFFAVAGEINRRTSGKKVLVMSALALCFCLTAAVGRVVDLVSNLGEGGIRAVITPEFFWCLFFFGTAVFAIGAGITVSRKGELKAREK